MATTLREMLQSDAIRAGQPEVLSGAARLEQRVRWVHVSEVREVTGLLSGGEVLLTTGLALREDPLGYLDAVVDAGAVALVVELGQDPPALPALPAPLVARAREREFVLVALHATTRFVDVTEQVHRALVAEQFESVRFGQEVHERFTRLSLDAAVPQRIVDEAAALCGSSVVLEDAARRVVAYAARGRPEAGLLADWERRSRLAGWSDRTAVTGPEGWVATPVGVTGQHWARLVVPDPGQSQDRLTLVVERAAQALELGRRVEYDRTGLHLQAQAGLLTDLAGGRLTEDDAVARARALGVEPARWQLAVVLHQRLPAGTDPVGAHRRARGLVERASDAVRATSLTALVGGLSEREAGLLLCVRSAAAEDAALTRLAEALAEQRDLDRVSIGVGVGSTGLVAAAAGLDTARHVAEVASAYDTGKAFARPTDVRLPGLVALLRDDPRVQAFAATELDPLLAHEAARGGDLVEILRQYVAVSGNKTELARVTHRNRSALYKKLAQIERILGIRLDDPVSLLSLGVAFLVHDLPGRVPAPTGNTAI